jgi:hypothetical protein
VPVFELLDEIKLAFSITRRFATEAAKELEVNVVESIAEPEPHLVRKSLLKSAFAHGKHKVQVAAMPTLVEYKGALIVPVDLSK